ncbi:MAG: hypothetical protein N3G78_04485 [Desulfobacterota bacterium]|nr:hypothetical protein [Thermodesulfobacteriota bacterium]
MERRRLIQRSFEALVLAGLVILGGCSKKDPPSTFGNQEHLWRMLSGEEKVEEPIELASTKQTPALYRDASMGKADPSFVPKIGGG